MDGAGASEPDKVRPALGADLIIPLLAAVFTIYFLVSTAHLTWEARANGVLIGTLLLTLVMIQIVRIGIRLASGNATLGLGEFASWTPTQKRRLALLATLIVFVVLVPWLGTTLSLILVMAASLWVMGVREPRTLIVVPLLTAGAVYLVFIVLLQSRLPRGIVEQLISWALGAGG